MAPGRVERQTPGIGEVHDRIFLLEVGEVLQLIADIKNIAALRYSLPCKSKFLYILRPLLSDPECKGTKII